MATFGHMSGDSDPMDSLESGESVGSCRELGIQGHNKVRKVASSVHVALGKITTGLYVTSLPIKRPPRDGDSSWDMLP